MKKITKIKIKWISKEILKYLALGGAIYIAASSPYFILQVMKRIKKLSISPRKKFSDAFNYLRSRGLIEVRRENHDICITLTPEGRKRAGKYQIDDLEIIRPKKWDKRWRLVIFDIPHEQRVKRNAFRKKLKELGFYSLQKSVWVHVFDCKGEITLLRDFFGLNKKQIQLLLVQKLENDLFLKKFFHL